MSNLLNGVWQYSRHAQADSWLETKFHVNNTVRLKGGWTAGGSVLIESFAFDESFYRDYRLLQSGPAADALLPFRGTPHLHNRDYVAQMQTPQFAKFSGSVFYLWGRDENFFEWSSGDIAFATLALDWRPSTQLRVSPEYQLQSYRRHTDGSTVGLGRIPRLRVEYQVSRPIFLRVIGEYTARRQDTLRDDSRTELPIVVVDPATNTWEPQSAFERNRFRVDALFSYQPTPGTVFFAGYSSILTEPTGLRFMNLRRTNDGFFVKASYLFRL